MKAKNLIGGLCLLGFLCLFGFNTNDVYADWNYLQRNGLGGIFSQNDIYFYDPCDGGSSLARKMTTAEGGCTKLAELRTAMWDSASDKDKENFMYVVSHENDSLAGIEGYMNQVIARSNGNLNGWLNGLCGAFRGGQPCSGSHSISEREQRWIEKALAGSNVTNFATGNASWYPGGDAGTGGHLSCLWVNSDNENGGECKDLDYDSSPYKNGGMCSEMISAAGGNINSGWECWGWDNTETWSDSMKSQCGGSQSVGLTTVESDDSASNVEWSTEGWITGGMEGYTKEEAPALNTKYDGGKPNKIILHNTQGETAGLAAYGDKRAAAHFTIDLLNKKVSQHYPISVPSGALVDSADVMDNIQIEIVGFGFQADNPDNPSETSKCIIDGTDYTGSKYCFSKISVDGWNYLGKLLTAINKWGSANGANLPLTTPVSWKGDVNKLRMTESAFKKATGILAHMHVPGINNHNDTGNIWPFVQAALSRSDCNLSTNEDSISGAKNAEKQANEVGPLTFGDGDNASMKTLLENYGDLAYRTGNAYGIPWIAILVQGRYEDPKAVCGNNNFWGIACYPGTGTGGGSNVTNLGEGFELYGKTIHNGYYDVALKQTDPFEYLKALGPVWVQGDSNGPGYSTIDGMKNSINSLTEYINSPEGQAVVAQFGAVGCGDSTGSCSTYVAKDASGLQALVKEWAYEDFNSKLNTPKTAYANVMKHTKHPGAGACGLAGKDCGSFVYNLIYESGWDTDYVPSGTYDQVPYLRKSDKWDDVTSKIKNNSDAMPGDVIICNNAAGITCPSYTIGHVLIYVGDIGFSSPMASASYCQWWPTSDYASDISQYINEGYHVFRNTEGATAEIGAVLNSWGESLMFRQCSGSCDSAKFGATSACGLIATTMAIAILNNDQSLTPMAVSQKIKSEVSGWHDYGNGHSDDINWWALRESAPKLYGLRSGEVFTGKANARKISTLRSHLQSGHMIVASIFEKNGVRPLFLLNTGGPTRTRSSHAIMFYKYENGKYWVKDSAPSVKVSSIGYTEDDLYKLFRAGSSVWWFGH